MHQPDLCRLLYKNEADGAVEKGDSSTNSDEGVHGKGSLGELLRRPTHVIPCSIDVDNCSEGKGENIGELRRETDALVGHHQPHGND